MNCISLLILAMFLTTACEEKMVVHVMVETQKAVTLKYGKEGVEHLEANRRYLTPVKIEPEKGKMVIGYKRKDEIKLKLPYLKSIGVGKVNLTAAQIGQDF